MHVGPIAVGAPDAATNPTHNPNSDPNPNPDPNPDPDPNPNPNPNQSMPVIEALEARGLLRKIDGSGDAEAVSALASAAFEPFAKS